MVFGLLFHGLPTLGLKVMKMPPRNTIRQGLSNNTKSTLQFP